MFIEIAQIGHHFGSRCRQWLSNPFLMGGLVGNVALQRFLEPLNFSEQPDAFYETVLGRRFRVVETYSEAVASSLGSTYLPFIEPVIFIKKGLKEANQDAYSFLLKYEVHRIDSSRRILEPIAHIAHTVAVAYLMPVTTSLSLMVGLALSVYWLTSRLFDKIYNERLFDQLIHAATSDEKKSVCALSNCSNGIVDPLITARIEEQPPVSFSQEIALKAVLVSRVDTLVVKNEYLVRPGKRVLREASPEVKQFFQKRVERFHAIKKRDLCDWALPLLVNLGALFTASIVIPTWSVMLLTPLTQQASLLAVRPYLKKRSIEQIHQIDRDLNHQKSVRLWLQDIESTVVVPQK